MPKVARKCFDSLVALICGLLWKERNNRTFDRRVHTIQETLAKVKEEIIIWHQAGFRQLELAAGACVGLPGRANVLM